MRLGLFASNDVGLEIAGFLKERGQRLALLALDSKDSGGLNAQILASSDAEEVIASDVLYQETTLAKLRGLQLDLIVLAWWPYILKSSVIDIPKIGCLNFHNSYLPFNRGKHPNFWSIVEGTPYGGTIHFVDPGVDSGDIAYQAHVEATWEDTGKTLHEKGKQALVRLFKEKFPEIINGDIPRIRQDLTRVTFHKSSEIEEASRIDLDRTYKAADLLNLLRARTFPPNPAAWFVDGGETYEVRVEIKKVQSKSR